MNARVRYSQISPEIIRNEIIKRYYFNNTVSCIFYRMGMNDIYLINNDNKKYYLRVSLANVYKYTDYKEEAFIVDSLYKNNINVAYPIECKDGNFVWTIDAPEGERYAILFSEAKNKPSQDIQKGIYNLGTMIAKIHSVADDKSYVISRPSIDLIQLVDEPISLIKKHFVNRMDDFEYLKNSTKKLGEFINDTLPTKKPYYGFCHGDIHLMNVNFDDEKPTIYDFDCMGNGWRSHDIAVFLFNHSLGNENYKESSEWKLFLNGYNSIRMLEENEVKALSAFCALRNTWVMGVHTKLSDKNMGCQMFNDNYFNFFINNFKMWFNRTFE